MAKEHLPPPRNNREKLLKECWDRGMSISMMHDIIMPIGEVETIEAKERMAGEMLERLRSEKE